MVMADRQPVAVDGPRLEADQVQGTLDIAIADDDASTIIHVRGPGTCTRMSDLGFVFDKLGVDVISCSTMPSAGSCDMTLVVVDRHDSQPLDDCLKQSVREGLHSVLQQCSGYSSSSSNRPSLQAVRSGPSLGSGGTAGTAQQQQVRAAVPPKGCTAVEDSRSLLDLCRADSASESIRSSKVCSRQPSFTDALQDQQQAAREQQQGGAACANGNPAAAVAAGSGPLAAVDGSDLIAADVSDGSSSSKVRFSLDSTLPTVPIAVPLRSASFNLRPALKIDIPFETSSSSINMYSSQTTTPTLSGRERSSREQAGIASSTAPVAAAAAVEQQQAVKAQDLAQRLLLLGMKQIRRAADSSSDSSDDEHGGGAAGPGRSSGSSRSSSRLDLASARQRKWEGPLSCRGYADLLTRDSLRDGAVQRISSDKSSDRRRRSMADFPSGDRAAASGPERSSNSDSSMRPGLSAAPAGPLFSPCAAPPSVTAAAEVAAGNSNERQQLAVPPSPCVGSKARRRPPARTPSRIILSPVAPDGTSDPQGQPKLFVSIPKASEEKRIRRPVQRSVTCSLAATPCSTGRQSVLQQLLGPQSLDKLISSSTSGGGSPKAAAAAAAAAGMPYNVAVAAAQLLGSHSNTREVAAAAIAATVANEQQAGHTPLGSPITTAPSSAVSSADKLMSPLAMTPRGLPLTPATPVHPAVAAVAASFIAAAAEEAGEAAAAVKAAAAAKAEAVEAAGLPSGSSTIEEGEEVGSMDSQAGDADVEDGGMDSAELDGDGSSSEEWWCGDLTGLAVRDIMVGPVRVVHQDVDVSVARQMMVQHNLPGMLVDTGPGSEPGFLTRRDFFKASLTRRHRRRPAKACVRDIMSHPVITVDAGQPIELCAQMMQERGIRRAVVRDAAAADSDNHMTEFVGLVSDASIFRCLGLYPEDTEDGMLVAGPAAFRLNSSFLTADSSADGSGLDTPCSTSRAATPLAAGLLQAPQQQLQGQQQQQHQQHQQQQPLVLVPAGEEAVTAAAGSSLDSLSDMHAKPELLTLPDVALTHEGVKPSSSAASSSAGSAQPSQATAAATAAQLAAAEVASSRADSQHARPGPLAAVAAADGSAGSDHAASAGGSGSTGACAVASGSDLRVLLGSGSGSVSSGAPDALSRYRTAASLWEVDMDEMEMIRKIGEGSFGEVMVANYRGTKVAVKRLRVLDQDDTTPYASDSSSTSGISSNRSGGAGGGTQAAFRQFFEREIAILASIRHPNVVNFIGACHKPGQRCLVTEYCARGSLDQVLHKSGLALDLVKRVEFAMDVVRGMACLHAQRPIIIHRDLKTANLLVSARFEVKVADFGLSRIKDASHLQVSRAGLEGTIEYCAPEVLRGEPYTERCDVYSFGVVLWELILRQRPYSDTDVPVFLLMVNIGNGSLKLPDIPVEEATPGLVDLTQRCLSFAASDRPEFREVLQLLEAEYRGLRAAAGHGQPRQQQQQQQQQAAAGQQQAVQRPAVQQPQPPVLRCDSASSMAVHQSPCVTNDGQDTGNTSSLQSPAGSGSARCTMLPAAVGAGVANDSAGSSVAAAAGVEGMHLYQHDPYYFQQQYYQQQQQQPVLQLHTPQPQLQQSQQQRHRLSQADSLASNGCAAPLMGVPCGMMYEHQHQHQVLSVPLPQLVIPQQQYSLASSAVNSPRQQRHQQQFQQQFYQQQPAHHVRVMSAFGVASTNSATHQQQLTPGGVMPAIAANIGAAGVAASTSKPPRQKQHMSRARSMPTPQSMDWGLDEEQDSQEDTDGTDGGFGGSTAGDFLLVQDDSFSSDYGGMQQLRCVPAAYAPCAQSGQLCMVLDPAGSNAAAAAAGNSGMLPQVFNGAAAATPVYLAAAHPQQQVLLTTQQGHAVPVVFHQASLPAGFVHYQQQPQSQQQHVQQLQQQLQQQPPVQQQQVCVQQQPQQLPQQQQAQLQQQVAPQALQQQRLQMQRGLFTPSPTPAALATPPLSSSPSLNNLNPLAVMAAAGAAAAAARRGEGSSGAASPSGAAWHSGSFAGMHRRSSSQGGCRQVPPLQLMQFSEIGSPTCLSAREQRTGSETSGHSTPVRGMGASGPVAAPLLLQRLDNLNRSGSASPRSGALHILPAPALQTEHSGQLVGVLIGGSGGSGPASGNASPLGMPGMPSCGHHSGHIRHASSRLAIQGSYELPPIGAPMQIPTAAAGGSSGAGAGADGAVHPVLGSTPPGGPSFLHQAHQHLQQSRRPSLLRIGSNSRDRSVSPFATLDSNNAAVAAAAAGHSSIGRSPFAAAAGAGPSSSGNGPAASPFAAAAAAGASSDSGAAVSPFAAAAGGAGGAIGSPFALATGNNDTAASAARAVSPFAAVAGTSCPFAAAATGDGAPEAPTAAPAPSPFAAAAAVGSGSVPSPFAAASGAPSATASPFAAAAGGAASVDVASSMFSSDIGAGNSGAAAATPAAGGWAGQPGSSATGRFASPFAAAAAASPAEGDEDADTGAVADKNAGVSPGLPANAGARGRSPSPRPAAGWAGSNKGVDHGDGSFRAAAASDRPGGDGASVAGRSSKPALSPFALLQQMQPDDEQ